MSSSRRNLPVANSRYSAQHPIFETLEARQLLSSSVSNGILTVEGTPKSDQTISVNLAKSNHAYLAVRGAGPRAIYAVSTIKEIDIFAHSGDKIAQITPINGAVDINGYIKGGPGNQTLSGSVAQDTLRAGNGNDLVLSNGSADLLVGGPAGSDSLLGNSSNGGHDTIDGGTGSSAISDDSGTDVVHSGSGSNVIEDADEPLDIVEPSDGSDFYTAKPVGYSPNQVRNGYGFGSLSNSSFTNRGQGQIIAIVDAYDDPTALNDLTVFSQTFGLPLPNASNFAKVFASGTQPTEDGGWAQEISLDIEWTHAIAPDATIILVEAASNLPQDLDHAATVASGILNADAVKGGVVSMSFGGGETLGELQQDITFDGNTAPGVSYIASSGDTGGALEYPAMSPFVTSVGGTTYPLDAQGNPIGQQIAWVNGGGGVSTVEPLPNFQQGLTINMVPVGPNRVGPDVAFLADPATGVAVYDTTPNPLGNTGWAQVGGTSLSAPLFAATVTLGNQQRTENGLPPIGSELNDEIYKMNFNQPGAFFSDIVPPLPPALPQMLVNPVFIGFDLATGWGTPIPGAFTSRLGLAGISGFENPFYLYDDISWGGTLYDDYSTPLSGSSPASASFNGGGVAFGDDNINMSLAANDSIGGTLTSFTIFGLTRSGDTFDGAGEATITGPSGTIYLNIPLEFEGTVGPDQNGFDRISGSFFTVDINGNEVGQATPGDFEGTFHD